ncbi:MAG TPA: TerB family tellurite resistance protein [Flavobacteriaceae bacterium]|nr:TerB family tellurite resistance protein [Flavobacteriaceae bacterium]MCB9212383.1 TerB family tellurite resistance protein [Alteromonas sp.]HPF11659.1 TerB family tellurite resistance protein [Flavobacteriaceae bacterium]HQU20134.1 TerB family tellurite resistance protein [Flavobacteriaceae bacterium]HQU64777.1 TerB family tellurite resistance protein [Flavobacteriaceae bacterium]
MDHAHQKSLLSDLIFLAKADGIIDPSERDFIHRIGQRMGLDSNAIDALFQNPVPSVPLFTELERITHFHRLLLVMNVDRETHEKEIIALRNFGLKMGIRQGAIDQILQKMNDFEDKIIPSNELIAIFQTYYN